MSAEKTLDLESVLGWTVEVDGVLVGFYDSADEAAEWMMWEGPLGADFHGVIRPVLAPETDDSAGEEIYCEDCGEIECECSQPSDEPCQCEGCLGDEQEEVAKR